MARKQQQVNSRIPVTYCDDSGITDMSEGKCLMFSCHGHDCISNLSWPLNVGKTSIANGMVACHSLINLCADLLLFRYTGFLLGHAKHHCGPSSFTLNEDVSTWAVTLFLALETCTIVQILCILPMQNNRCFTYFKLAHGLVHSFPPNT